MHSLIVACERANRTEIYNAITGNRSQMATLRSIKDRYAGHGKAYEFVLRKARELKMTLTRQEMVSLAGTIWLEAWRA